jgi:hypothetical protein
VDDFLADQGAGDVAAVTADPHDPGDLREVQVPRASDPQGPLDDAAVAVVELDVIRGFLARVLDLAEDGLLEAWLVALDEQEVVRVPAAVFFRPGPIWRKHPDQTGREAVPANHGQRNARLADHHPAVKSGTHAHVDTPG